MAPRTGRTTRIPSAVASPITTNYVAKGCMCVDLTSAGDLNHWSWAGLSAALYFVSFIREVHAFDHLRPRRW